MKALPYESVFKVLRQQSLIHPVIHLPQSYQVLDFSAGQKEPSSPSPFLFTIGKYNEERQGLYPKSEFGDRCIHMGIDIGTPEGTQVYSFFAGTIYQQYIDSHPFGFGPCVVTKHEIAGLTFYALYGHLSKDSIEVFSENDSFSGGTVLGKVGEKAENGGWNPHLHFQISMLDPKEFSIQGVISKSDRQVMTQHYPDPRIILGALY